MSAILGRVFPIVANEWEECLAAASFLHAIPFADSVFDSDTAKRVQGLLESLRQLPPTWARELATEALRGGSRAA